MLQCMLTVLDLIDLYLSSKNLTDSQKSLESLQHRQKILSGIKALECHSELYARRNNPRTVEIKFLSDEAREQNMSM